MPDDTSGHFSDNPEDFFADYTARDWEVVDYQFYHFDFLPKLGFRGPPMDADTLAAGNYCTAVGAAQTLGVYIETPFNTLFEQRTGLPCLNLGLGGGSPTYFANQPGLIELMNRGRFVILQVMTARGQENSRMQPVGIDYVRDRKSGEVSLSGPVWMRLLAEEKEKVPGYIAENLQDWRASYQRLIEQITVPILLFNFSHKPDHEPIDLDAKNTIEFFGSFPQFVNRPDIDQVAALCAGYAECKSVRGFPHPLTSRFSGEPVAVDWGKLHPHFAGYIESANTYYPSREMHQDAADTLAAACKAHGWL